MRHLWQSMRLSRKEHLHHHMKNVHGESNSVQSIPIANGSLVSNSSTTEEDMYTDDEMEGQSEESYRRGNWREKTEEESSKIYDESEKEDNNPWKLILNEVYQNMDPIRDASIDKTMQEDEITHEEATKHVYDALVPAYTKELMKVYKKYLRLLKGLQRDSTHRKIWKTIKRLKEEKDYDEDESIDAAVNNSDTDMDHE